MSRFLKDTKKYYKYAIYSAKSKLQSEVASSYLNWLWWVLDPICFMLIYTLIFGVVFNAKEQYFTVVHDRLSLSFCANFWLWGMRSSKTGRWARF